MANEDLELPSGVAAPAADIPDLKKKEKERKKAGAAWGGGRGAGSPFSGATGGGGAARAAASAAGSAASEAARATAMGGVRGLLARLLATGLGKAVVAASAACFLAGAGLIGYSMWLGRGGAAGAIGGGLSAPTDSVKIDRGSGSSTGYVAGKGEIRFDPAAPSAPPPLKPAAAAPEPAPAQDLLAHATISDTQGGAKDRLAHNLAGAKLTQNLGGSFGAKNVFSGGSGSAAAPKFNADLAKAGGLAARARNGKAGAFRGNARTATGRSANVARGRASRAFGQLRIAKGMSAVAADAPSDDKARGAAADAFDQRSTTGGELQGPGIGNDLSGTPTGIGTGAPDITSVPSVPDVPGTAGDPRMDDSLRNIGRLANQAGKLKMMGMMLIALGAVIMAIGASLLSNPLTAAIGAALMATGIAIMMAGYMMMQMAAMMADMAKAMGQAFAAQYGTTYQGDIVNECTDQALGGTPVENCNPATRPDPGPSTVHEDVRQERDSPASLGGP